MRNLINIVTEAQREATIEDVYDMLDDYVGELENMAEPPFNEIYSEDNQKFPQLFMGGYPEDGFSKAIALKLIRPLLDRLEELGWFLAKAYETQYDDGDDDPDAGSPQILIFFGFFPRNGTKERVPQIVYHLSPRANREQIEREGIKASLGGTDFINTVNRRVYVILNSDYIESMKADIMKHRGSEWEELDVWAIATWQCADEWYEDFELPSVAAWTPQDIPRKAISLI